MLRYYRWKDIYPVMKLTFATGYQMRSIFWMAVRFSARDRFANLKQGNKSVQEYVSAMQDILLEATDIALPEAIDHFIRHLKPQLFAKVRSTQPSTPGDAYKAAFNEEICCLPAGVTVSSGFSPVPISSTSAFLMILWIFLQHLQQNQQSRFNSGYNKNNNNNWKQNNRSRFSNHNDDRNNNTHVLNILLEKMNLLSDSVDDNKNNLADLSSDPDEDNHSSYASTVPFDFSTASSDIKLVNNISNNLSAKLPLYSVMVGRSHFKKLIDSGASASYAHPINCFTM
ncbi:hypothetical protein [Parasitella parasitica]|uniref:Retrotransposon gag domain-containing protein n=1 Tax=Parasitella parasitica TaxID=35722 RepID=A0A0B7NCE5_9FUNG|nr:hypothetical protein [Parasitella parasitica]